MKRFLLLPYVFFLRMYTVGDFEAFSICTQSCWLDRLKLSSWSPEDLAVRLTSCIICLSVSVSACRGDLVDASVEISKINLGSLSILLYCPGVILECLVLGVYLEFEYDSYKWGAGCNIVAFPVIRRASELMTELYMFHKNSIFISKTSVFCHRNQELIFFCCLKQTCPHNWA